MSEADVEAKEVTFSLKVMLNKERNKVLFAVADNHFVDILLSFLTLPLGRIIKVLKKHYGERSPTIGSLNTLYNSLANLESAHFVTEGAKETLLHLTSSFEAKYEKLKVDITDSPPAEYFFCSECRKDRFRSLSIYYDTDSTCYYCKGHAMSKEVVERSSEAAASSDGVFTTHSSSFLISNDLHIIPQEAGIIQTISILGITDIDKSETIKVHFGFNEIMKLLKASLTSPTPLADVILNNTTELNYSSILESHYAREDNNPGSCSFILKLIVQKSTGKLLYAQAKEEFVEFLFSLLFIPLGGVGHLLDSKTCFKAIYNLHRSAAEFMDNEHLKSPDTKESLTKPTLPHGCISENYILPLSEEGLSRDYCHNLSWFSSHKFPEGKGRYLQRPRSYQVKDDLSVEPYCFVSILSSLSEQKVMLSDLKEVEVEIGLKEALSILKASLTSTSALSDALLNHTSIEQPKSEI